MAENEQLEGEPYPTHLWLPGAGASQPIVVPRRPHMPEAAIAWLEERLRSTKCFLEYGMGGSTWLAASLGVPQIVSVESDAAFAEAVRAEIEGMGSESRIEIVRANIGPTGEWGYPTGFEAFRRWPDYLLDAWERIRALSLSPDLVLIDGRFRVGCFLASLLESRPGTIIMFDDYLSRMGEYSHVEAFLAPTEFVDRCAIFTVPEEVRVRDVGLALARFVCRPE